MKTRKRVGRKFLLSVLTFILPLIPLLVKADTEAPRASLSSKWCAFPVVATRYNFFDRFEIADSGVMTVGAFGRDVTSYFRLFGFYGPAFYQQRTEQVAGVGAQYTDFVGVTALVGVKVTESWDVVKSDPRPWFVGVGVTFSSLDFSIPALTEQDIDAN